MCGRNFCPSNADEEGVIEKPTKLRIYILASIFLLIAMSGAAVVALLVDPLKRFDNFDINNNLYFNEKRL